MTSAPPVEQPSGWAPLRHALFRDRWIASVVSNIGTWMQDTAGAWLMTALTTSPLLVALMQTAASLPVLLLALPAGATADIFDRRRLLLFWQAWMLATVAVLSALTFAGFISPWGLLGLTLLLNVGSAMNNPAWQAIVPELVAREELPDAIAINSAGFNLARAVGPALGGLAVAAFTSPRTGAAFVFLLNSISFVAVLMVLYRWRRVPIFKSALPAERLFGSIRAGLRYVRYAPTLRAILGRAFLWPVFASAVWALLPVVARQDLQRGAMAYGVLNACIGVGAVIGASLLPKLRRRAAPDTIVGAAGAVFVVTLLVLAFVRNVPLIIVSLVAAGLAWTSVGSTMNVAVQLSVPAWVQARALGTYQMVFWGGMAIGSALWGLIADHVSTAAALATAAAGLAISLPLARRLPLPHGAPPDMSPYQLSRPTPEIVIEPQPDDGPVLVMIEYRIDPADYEPFTRAIHRMRDVRLRDGAIRWGVFRDARQPTRIVETMVAESWIAFLRQRERMTAADTLVRDEVRAFHRGESQPVASYMMYAREPHE